MFRSFKQCASSQRRRARCSFAAAGLAWILAGCVDPGGKFDEFTERKGTSEPPSGDGDAPLGEGGACTLAPGTKLPTPEQIDGTYLYVVSTSLGLLRPLVYMLEVDAEMDATSYTLSLREQPLSASDRATPVGEFGEWRTYTVAPTGCYETDLTTVVTPAAANPILPAEATSELIFRGNVAQARLAGGSPDGLVEFWCGTVEGMVLRPLSSPVTGTFTATRISRPRPST